MSKILQRLPFDHLEREALNHFEHFEREAWNHFEREALNHFETESGESQQLEKIKDKSQKEISQKVLIISFYQSKFYPYGDKEKKVINVENLKFAFTFARQDLEDRWEWYKEQYLKKLKK